MNRSSHIGVFDSGVGGLTVLKELRKELPNESFIYLADSGNAPYGSLSGDEIIKLAFHNAEFLIEKKVKIIVVACNTATGAAIKPLRESFDLHFIGMEPAIKPAAGLTSSSVIGVLATARTFEADHYNSTVKKLPEGVELIVQIGEGLVELIEEGNLDSPDLKRLVQSYISPMIDKGADQLVLGCTHYPFLIPIIKEIVPEGVVIHDPAPAVARQTRRILEENNGFCEMKNQDKDLFFSTGDKTILDKMLKLI